MRNSPRKKENIHEKHETLFLSLSLVFSPSEAAIVAGRRRVAVLVVVVVTEHAVDLGEVRPAFKTDTRLRRAS